MMETALDAIPASAGVPSASGAAVMAAPAGTTTAADIGVSERLATRIPPAKDGIGSTTVVVIAERRATAADGMTVPGMDVVTVLEADGSTTTGFGIGVGATRVVKPPGLLGFE